MIFICVGSREYQFNRLLKEIDKLIEEQVISEPVFAQIGLSDYKPKFYDYSKFLSQDEFHCYQKEASLIISHGGTGALVNALKLGKKVIAVPRLSFFKEHTDDHQTQVSDMLFSKGYTLGSVKEIADLKNVIMNYDKKNTVSFESKSMVLEIIRNYLGGRVIK